MRHERPEQEKGEKVKEKKTNQRVPRKSKTASELLAECD